MHFCPFCGHELSVPVKDGSASCSHCSRVFDTSPYYKLLSAAWSVKRNPELTPKHLEDYGFTENEALFAHYFVSENCYSMQEFELVLKEFGVSKFYVA